MLGFILSLNPREAAVPLLLHPAKWLQRGLCLDPGIKELKPEYMAQSS